MALLAAIRECANHDLPMPEWVSHAYIRAYDMVLNCKAGSWDEVFGRPYRKGAQLAAMRKRRIKRLAVWNEARRIILSEPETPIDVAFFERIGEKLAIGKTLASELYYEEKNGPRWSRIVEELLEPYIVKNRGDVDSANS